MWISARQKLSKLMYCISWHMDSKLPSVKRQRRDIQKWRMAPLVLGHFRFLICCNLKKIFIYLKQSFYKIINWWKIIYPASLFSLFALGRRCQRDDLILFETRVTIQCHGGLQSRELGQCNIIFIPYYGKSSFPQACISHATWLKCQVGIHRWSSTIVCD